MFITISNFIKIGQVHGCGDTHLMLFKVVAPWILWENHAILLNTRFGQADADLSVANFDDCPHPTILVTLALMYALDFDWNDLAMKIV